jgi:hypothetical protein
VEKNAPKKRSGRRGDPVSAAPLTPEQLVKGIFQISKEDVKRIVASRPGKKKNSPRRKIIDKTAYGLSTG